MIADCIRWVALELQSAALAEFDRTVSGASGSMSNNVVDADFSCFRMGGMTVAEMCAIVLLR